jgi:hypothetical protein
MAMVGMDSNYRPPPCQSCAIRLFNNLEYAGTAKIRVSRTRHRMLWVGLWVGIYSNAPLRMPYLYSVSCRYSRAAVRNVFDDQVLDCDNTLNF